MNFTDSPLTARVVFGVGRRHEIASEADRLGGKRALVLATSFQAELAADVGAMLGDRCVAIHTGSSTFPIAPLLPRLKLSVRRLLICLLRQAVVQLLDWRRESRWKRACRFSPCRRRMRVAR